MKRSFTANINGTIFYIDEDAFDRLHSYIDQLRTAFPGPDGAEIVGDIEARVAELLSERETGNSKIVTIEDINTVIARVGSPSDLNDSPEPITTDNETQQTRTTTPPPYFGLERPTKRLFRDESNQVLGGVLSGLGEYYHCNIGLLRVLAVLITLSTAVMPCVIAYVIAWCVIPAAKTPVQQLEMSGQPINPATLSQQMLNDHSKDSAMSQIGRIVSVGCLVFAGMISGALFCGAIALLLWSISSLIGLSIFSIPWGTNLAVPASFLMSGVFPSFTLFLSLAATIFLGVILWAIGMSLFKLPRISGTVLIGCGITELILVIAVFITGHALKASVAML